jgi:hypothetical protein
MQVEHALRALILGCLVAMPAAYAADANTPMDFTAAKAAADADEASQGDTARATALQQQGAFLDAAVVACADARSTAQLEAFVVVVELDATGHVVRTWRRGDSPLALCIERQSRGKLMFVPPRAPFHASLEVSFTP